MHNYKTQFVKWVLVGGFYSFCSAFLYEMSNYLFCDSFEI